MEFLASAYCPEAGLWAMVPSQDSLIDIWSSSHSEYKHAKIINGEKEVESFSVWPQSAFHYQEMNCHGQTLVFRTLSFLHNAHFLRWPRPTHQQGSLLSPRKTGGYDCKSAHIWWEGFCLHVFSIWNAAFANTHSGLGGTQQIFLVTPAMLLKTPPPTPAQLFRVIPEKGPCAA